MGWITVGQIQIYSIGQDISDFTTLVFHLVIDLINPFTLIVFILFIVSMIIYILHYLAKNIEQTTDIR